MKTRVTKSLIAKSFVVIIFTLVSQVIKAGDYQTFYLDSLSDWGGDTIMYCSGNDSIRLIAPEDVENIYWDIYPGQEKVYRDTFVLPNGFTGMVDCRNNASYHFTLEIYPFMVEACQDININYGETAQLDIVSSSYTTTDSLLFAWSPATGLNNSSIKNPISSVGSTTEYVVTAEAPNGCLAEDTVVVNVTAFTVEAGEDKTITCGGTVQLDEVTTNYNQTGTLTYSWSPTTGLDDPAIKNPTATVNDNTKFYVTVSTPDGTQATDSVSVWVEAMSNPEICMVGIDTSNKNIIVWDKPLSDRIDSFYIYRETDVTDVYQKLSAVAYEDNNVYVDSSSNPDIQSNKYKISLLDACGLESDLSPYHKTMHLSLNQGQDNVWNLIWESYEGFPVSTYRIYRSTNSVDFELIGTSSASNTQYSDFSAPEGTVYYQVEIINPNSCSSGKKSSANAQATYSSSRSNIVTNKRQTSGINELMNSKFCTVYPNPANSEIHIQLNKEVTSESLVEIIDVNGQIVEKSLIHSGELSLNIESLQSGVYVVRIKTDNEPVYQKFVKR